MENRLKNLSNHFKPTNGLMTWTLKTFMPFDFTKTETASLKG